MVIVTKVAYIMDGSLFVSTVSFLKYLIKEQIYFKSVKNFFHNLE